MEKEVIAMERPERMALVWRTASKWSDKIGAGKKFKRLARELADFYEALEWGIYGGFYGTSKTSSYVEKLIDDFARVHPERRCEMYVSDGDLTAYGMALTDFDLYYRRANKANILAAQKCRRDAGLPLGD